MPVGRECSPVPSGTSTPFSVCHCLSTPSVTSQAPCQLCYSTPHRNSKDGWGGSLWKPWVNYFIGKRKKKKNQREGAFSHFRRMPHNQPVQSVKLLTGCSQPWVMTWDPLCLCSLSLIISLACPPCWWRGWDQLPTYRQSKGSMFESWCPEGCIPFEICPCHLHSYETTSPAPLASC